MQDMTDKETMEFLRRAASWPSPTACLYLRTNYSFGMQITVDLNPEPKPFEWWKKL